MLLPSSLSLLPSSCCHPDRRAPARERAAEGPAFVFLEKCHSDRSAATKLPSGTNTNRRAVEEPRELTTVRTETIPSASGIGRKAADPNLNRDRHQGVCSCFCLCFCFCFCLCLCIRFCLCICFCFCFCLCLCTCLCLCLCFCLFVVIPTGARSAQRRDPLLYF